MSSPCSCRAQVWRAAIATGLPGSLQTLLLPRAISRLEEAEHRHYRH